MSLLRVALLLAAALLIGFAITHLVYDGDWRCMFAECRIEKR